jgi:hypothetical protein
VLRALKQLLRPGGRLAFTTIYVTPGLSPTLRRKAQRFGPRAVASRSEQHHLLASAGFNDIDAVDLTPEFAATARAWIDGRAAHEAELSALESPATFADRQRDGCFQLRAVEEGLLCRALFSATRLR